MARMRELETLWRGRKCDVRVVEVEIGAGGPRRELLVVHPGSVVLVPVLDDGRVVLIRSRRYAVGEVVLELPAGTVEPPEAPLDCARRELLEETGYRAGSLERLGGVWQGPSFSTEWMEIYVARGLVHEGQRLDVGEEIAVEAMDRAALRAAMRSGELRDAKSLAALQLLDLAEEAP